MILDACSRLRRPAVLATVVSVEGSAYRRPGARMLIEEGGATTGMVSGGCLETDLAQRAKEVLRNRGRRTVVYDMRSPDDVVWGLGLGCDGEVRVLLERLQPGEAPPWCRFALAARARRGWAAVATVFDSPSPEHVGFRAWVDDAGGDGRDGGDDSLARILMREAAAALEARRSRNVDFEIDGRLYRGLAEVVRPPVRLHLFGAGADAEPLAQTAIALGWEVRVYDHREPFARPERFPGAEVRCVDYARLDVASLALDARSAVLLLTHHFLHDRAVLERCLESPAAYCGVLGPRRRLERLLENLESEGVRPSVDALTRLHGPVGLDIGSETPEEIALSALAEIQAVMQGRDGGPLRDSPHPLHDWPR